MKPTHLYLKSRYRIRHLQPYVIPNETLWQIMAAIIVLGLFSIVFACL